MILHIVSQGGFDLAYNNSASIRVKLKQDTILFIQIQHVSMISYRIMLPTNSAYRVNFFTLSEKKSMIHNPVYSTAC